MLGMGTDLSGYRRIAWTDASRYICNQVHFIATNFLQLETGSRGSSNRCFPPALDRFSELGPPSMVFNQQSPGQSPTRKSDSCVGNSLVEEPSLVPNVNHHDSGLPSAPSQFSSDPDTITQLRLFSVTVTAATGRMENLRKYLKSKVIPEKWKCILLLNLMVITLVRQQ